MTKQFSLSKYIKGDILLILKGPHTRPQALLTSMKKRFCKVFALLNLREKWWVKIVITLFLISCNNINQPEKKLVEKQIEISDTVINLQENHPEVFDSAVEINNSLLIAKKDTSNYPVDNIYYSKIKIKDTKPEEVVSFARKLIGVPYLYGSSNPAQGFDCSGFITFVFNHFHINVPRSSVDFTNAGDEINIKQVQPGDLILFTGTDSTIRTVGHMGIIEHFANDTLFFIHSTSGKAKSVVITPFEKYYKNRFVKVIRIFAPELF